MTQPTVLQSLWNIVKYPLITIVVVKILTGKTLGIIPAAVLGWLVMQVWAFLGRAARDGRLEQVEHIDERTDNGYWITVHRTDPRNPGYSNDEWVTVYEED